MPSVRGTRSDRAPLPGRDALGPGYPLRPSAMARAGRPGAGGTAWAGGRRLGGAGRIGARASCPRLESREPLPGRDALGPGSPLGARASRPRLAQGQFAAVKRGERRSGERRCEGKMPSVRGTRSDRAPLRGQDALGPGYPLRPSAIARAGRPRAGGTAWAGGRRLGGAGRIGARASCPRLESREPLPGRDALGPGSLPGARASRPRLAQGQFAAVKRGERRSGERRCEGKMPSVRGTRSDRAPLRGQDALGPGYPLRPSTVARAGRPRAGEPAWSEGVPPSIGAMRRWARLLDGAGSLGLDPSA